MATGGIPAPGRSKKLPEVPVRKGGKQKKPVKVFITTYSDEFYTERDIVRKEVCKFITNSRYCIRHNYILTSNFILCKTRGFVMYTFISLKLFTWICKNY